MAVREVLEYRMEIIKGVTYRRAFVWEAEGASALVPNPLTGKTVVLKIDKVLSGSPFILRSGSPSPNNSAIQITDEPNGKFSLVLTDEETDLFFSCQTKYSITVENPDGTIDEFLVGQPALIREK